MAKKTAFGVTISKIAGLLLFLILLAAANIVEYSIDNLVYSGVVGFLNSQLGIIIMFSILFFLAELFEVFIFPFNLAYPLFNAFGSIFLIEFIFRIFSTVPMLFTLRILQMIITPLVFVIVLIAGYVKIITSFVPEKKEKKPKPKKKKDVNWRKKWDEFISALNDFFVRIREIFTEDKKK